MAPEGLEPNSTDLVLLESGRPSSGGGIRPSRVLGLFWCSLGSAFAVMTPVLANVLIAFGATVAMVGGQKRDRITTLLVVLVSGCVAALMLTGVMEIPSTVIAVLSAYVLARWMAMGRLDTNRFIAMVVVIACLSMGVDSVLASMHGTSITEVVSMTVDGVVEQSIGSLDMSETAALLEARDSMMAYWPTLYLAVGLGDAICSLMGAWMGAKTSGNAPEAGMLARFDVPLWVALLFSAGVVTELMASLVPSWQDAMTMVGANVVMCARLILMLQGLSVLQGLMLGKGLAKPVRMLVILLALWLEMSFALMSVVGLLDVALNFRHLRRKRPDLIQRPTEER